MFRIRNTFTQHIDHSTWMHKDAICQVSASSMADSCSFPHRNAGILRCTASGRSSAMSNPLSSINESFFSSSLNILQLFVNYLSGVLPEYRSDTKETALERDMPMRPCAVF